MLSYADWWKATAVSEDCSAFIWGMGGGLYPEDGGSALHRNVGNYSLADTA